MYAQGVPHFARRRIIKPTIRPVGVVLRLCPTGVEIQLPCIVIKRGARAARELAAFKKCHNYTVSGGTAVNGHHDEYQPPRLPSQTLLSLSLFFTLSRCTGRCNCTVRAVTPGPGPRLLTLRARTFERSFPRRRDGSSGWLRITPEFPLRWRVSSILRYYHRRIRCQTACYRNWEI